MSACTSNSDTIIANSVNSDDLAELKRLALSQILQDRRKTLGEIQAIGEISEDAAIGKLRDAIASEIAVLDAVTSANNSMLELVRHLDLDGTMMMMLEYARDRHERYERYEKAKGYSMKEGGK